VSGSREIAQSDRPWCASEQIENLPRNLNRFDARATALARIGFHGVAMRNMNGFALRYAVFKYYLAFRYAEQVSPNSFRRVCSRD
jgi:hypothetical protein